MRTFLLSAIGLAGLGIISLAWLFFGGPTRAINMNTLQGNAGRGAYVARLAGCVSCHTVPESEKVLAGGPKLVTQFGAFYGPNITQHKDEGIGLWTGADFADALVNGHSRETGNLYPVFPFTSYAKMTDQDVADLWTWLKTVPPDDTPSKPHEITNPLAVRVLMAPWKTLFHNVALLEDIPERSSAWNRGRYIVEGPGHCTECHTPRGKFGALDTDRHLEGGRLFVKGSKISSTGEKVPAITASALTERGYGRGDLLMAFQYGLTPDGDVLGGSMGEVLTDQLGYLSLEDLTAIAAYLTGASPE